MPTVLRIKGELDKDRLERSFREIIRRHETLRTVIHLHNGAAYQEVISPDGWKLGFHNNPGGAENGVAPDSLIADLIARPFDLETDFMFRADLIRLQDDQHLLVWVMHHIASDGWSLGILIKDLTELYQSYEEGRNPRLRESTIQYADYALWQRQYLSEEILEPQLKYWQYQLTGTIPLELPTDFARPLVLSSKGGSRSFRISAELRDSLQELSRRQRSTLFMTLLAAFNVLLYRYSGQDDICVGIPAAGRMHQELEELIGFFINTLAIRSELEENETFLSLLERIKRNNPGSL